MTAASRLRAIEDGQTGIARKVLAAVPLVEHWTVGKIIGELRRTGCNAEVSIVEGCLTSLVESGLVRRPQVGVFQRVPIPAEPARSAAEELETPPAPRQPPDLLERWGRIGAALRERATQLVALADDIDAAALETAEQLAKAGAGDEQLRKLRALLKAVVE